MSFSASSPQSASNRSTSHSGTLYRMDSALTGSVSMSGYLISSFCRTRLRRMPLHTPASPSMPSSLHSATDVLHAALSGMRSSSRIWHAPSRSTLRSLMSVSGFAISELSA